MQYTELICSAMSSLYNATHPLLDCINIVLKKKTILNQIAHSWGTKPRIYS